MTGRGAPQADHEQHHHAANERIGGHGKDASGLANASQVAPSDQPDASHRQRDTIAIQRRCSRDYRRDAGRDADGDCKHVINQKRRCRDEARYDAQIVLCNNEAPPPWG